MKVKVKAQVEKLLIHETGLLDSITAT